PGKAPRNLEVYPSPRKAWLDWKVVQPYYQYGKQISYRIIVKNLRTAEIDFGHHVAVQDQSKIDYGKLLDGLKGLTNYQLNVSLINVVGEGPITSLLFATLEGVPSAYPQQFSIVNVTFNTISATWEAIDFEETHGILRGYHIYYRLAGLNGTWANVSVTDLAANAPVLSLRSYEIRVCGYTRVGDGIISPIHIVNTTGFSKYIIIMFFLN
ncbi:Down syndrome cell adhesion molecule Dscam2, partial [Paramuricea clavata]